MFNKFGSFNPLVSLDIFSKIKKSEEKKEDVPKKWDIMFKDASIEGKKYGAEKAAKEYEKLYRELQQTYSETKIQSKQN